MGKQQLGGTLIDYLPKKNSGPVQCVQASCDRELVRAVKKKLDSEDLSWRELMTAALHAYLNTEPTKK